MKEIPIKRELSEDTRLESVYFNSQQGVFSLHFKDDCYYVTDHSDETKIYAVFTKEMYKIWFENEG